MPRLRAPLVVLLVALPALLSAVPAQDRPLHGACFGPFRPGEAPGALAPLPSTLAEDVATAARITGRIRTYGMGGGGWQVPELCEEHDLRCWPGAWLGRDRAANDRECELLIRTAQRHPEAVEAVLVGNEVLLRDDLPEAVLIRRIDQVKAGVEQPVTTAEPWAVWLAHPKLVKAVDVVTVHIHPYWDGVPAERAAQHTLDKLAEVRRAARGKRVVLGEFGWPTAGDTKGGAVPSREGMAHYLGDVLPALRKTEQEYFVFELWDEAWKAGDEGTVGPHWGLFTADGSPKLPDDFALDLRAGASSRPPRPTAPLPTTPLPTNRGG